MSKDNESHEVEPERTLERGEPGQRKPVEGLGLLFGAAAIGLALLLSLVAVFGYFALK